MKHLRFASAFVSLLGAWLVLVPGCGGAETDPAPKKKEPADTCGDGTCDVGETCESCGEDCGSCAATCGDGTCEAVESCAQCPADCGECAPVCPDGTCNGSETCTSCPADCGPCCGNDICGAGETCSNCPSDCGSCCGNGSCAGSETCASCPSDCGSCCGNGTCDPSESCSSCPSECGACPVCGDDACNGNESWGDCFDDCWDSAPAVQWGICGGGTWISDFAGTDFFWVNQNDNHMMYNATGTSDPVTFSDMVYGVNGYFLVDGVDSGMTIGCANSANNTCEIFLYRGGYYVDIQVGANGYTLVNSAPWVPCN